MRNYFYYKDKKQVVPVLDQEKNKQAKKKLDQILKTKKELIPEHFIERWSEVALYNPGGDVEKANAILIDPEDGAYDLSNPLNDMTGKEWVTLNYEMQFLSKNAIITGVEALQMNNLNLYYENNTSIPGIKAKSKILLSKI